MSATSSRWIPGVLCPACNGETLYLGLDGGALCVACPGDPQEDDMTPATLPLAPRRVAARGAR